MAGIQYKNGSATIQFTGPDKKRRTIRLNSISERNAERFADKLERLNTVVKLGQPLDDELGAWAAKLGDEMASKLSDYGLMTRRQAVKLGPFLDSYSATREDVKPSTMANYKLTIDNLRSFFGADRLLRDVTPGDADEYRLWLLKQKAGSGTGKESLAENTVRRRCTLAGQFFRAAMRKGLIGSNPFDRIGGMVRSNKARVYFISRADAAKVDAACPNLQFRVVFALARFGGLRTPSELRGLRWRDIDWARGKFLVHSPKTEHHDGGATRWVPLFPELRPLLDEAFHAAEDGAEYVCPRYRTGGRVRPLMRNVILRAGLTPWPKLFQNLRSTRQTELAATFPLHIVCSWLGNKAAVAAEHYLQVTDADFDAASRAASALHTGDDSKQLDRIPQPATHGKTVTNRDELSAVGVGGFDCDVAERRE